MSGRHSLRDERKEHKGKYLGREARRTVYYKWQGGNKKGIWDWVLGEKTTESWMGGGGSVSCQGFQQHHNREDAQQGKNVPFAEQRAAWSL